MIAERARDRASSFSSAPCASRRALHDSISGFLGRPKPKAQGSIWRYKLYFQKIGEDEENVVWSASKVVASHVEFYILVAHVLLLVDPIDDVIMAIM